jgi:hypothetical protein
MKTRSFLICVFFHSILIGYSQPANDTLLRQSRVFEEFIVGKVLSKSGEINEASLNYCAYDQSILFKNKGTVMSLTGLEAIDTIYIAGKKFIPVNNLVYELVDGKGKVQLCLDYSGKLVPWTATSDHSGSYTKQNSEVSNTVSSVYVNRPYKGEYSIQIRKKYWLKSYNNIYKANNLKDFIKVFKESSTADIADFVKQHHTDFSNEADLIALVNFANSK